DQRPPIQPFPNERQDVDHHRAHRLLRPRGGLQHKGLPDIELSAILEAGQRIPSYPLERTH
ncbi:hypothetical protein, partial [Brucella intermedia]|uniref:hypothetical protein n=1 Tax=Brucella intermedia TaxID=94625 RepID=UPI001AEC1987